ncbi:hypothetical protein HK101_005772 [Irineochytrium annulatum]|nr:hypothetical protein HK101_005772 [Irineochytrium annulatum]
MSKPAFGHFDPKLSIHISDDVRAKAVQRLVRLRYHDGLNSLGRALAARRDTIERQAVKEGIRGRFASQERVEGADAEAGGIRASAGNLIARWNSRRGGSNDDTAAAGSPGRRRFLPLRSRSSRADNSPRNSPPLTPDVPPAAEVHDHDDEAVQPMAAIAPPPLPAVVIPEPVPEEAEPVAEEPEAVVEVPEPVTEDPVLGDDEQPVLIELPLDFDVDDELTERPNLPAEPTVPLGLIHDPVAPAVPVPDAIAEVVGEPAAPFALPIQPVDLIDDPLGPNAALIQARDRDALPQASPGVESVVGNVGAASARFGMEDVLRMVAMAGMPATVMGGVPSTVPSLLMHHHMSMLEAMDDRADDARMLPAPVVDDGSVDGAANSLMGSSLLYDTQPSVDEDSSNTDKDDAPQAAPPGAASSSSSSTSAHIAPAVPLGSPGTKSSAFAAFMPSLLMSRSKSKAAAGKTPRPPRQFSAPARPPGPVRKDMSWISSRLATGFPPSFGIPDSVIQCILWFRELPPIGKLKAELLTRLVLRFDRFRSILIRDPANARKWQWELVEMFNIHPHVIQTSAKDEAAIERYFRTVPAIDRQLPLWNCHVITNSGTGRSCILFNIHHAIGDGMAMMTAAMSLFTDLSGNPIRRPVDPPPAPVPAPTPSLLSSVTGATVAAYLVVLGWFRAMSLPLTPHDTLTRSLHTRDATWLSRISTTSDVRRSVTLCPPLRLAALQAIKASVGGGATVNDVMAAALAGCFRRYLIEFEEGFRDFKGIRMRALMPVNLGEVVREGNERFAWEEEEEEGDVLHNNWSMMSVPLLVSIADPIDRVNATRAATLTSKATNEAAKTLSLQRAISGVLSEESQSRTLVDVFAAHTCVFANVPSMKEHVYLAKARVSDIHFVVPNMVHQVNMISYDGRIYCNFCTSDNVVRHPGALREYLVTELEVMAERCGIDGGVRALI